VKYEGPFTIGVVHHKLGDEPTYSEMENLLCNDMFNLYFYLLFMGFFSFRNNLTIIDAVVLTGQGGRGELRFSNRKPGSNSPLLFEMTDKHLKNCDSKCLVVININICVNCV